MHPGPSRAKRIAILVVIVVATTVAGAGTATAKARRCPTDGTPIRNLRYEREQGVDPDLLSVDVYPSATGCPSPVVVWVHGGGWRIGDKRHQMADKVAHWNALGYTVVSVNYRLTDPTAVEPVRYPAHNEDVAAAVAWVHENIGEVRRRPRPDRAARPLGRRGDRRLGRDGPDLPGGARPGPVRPRVRRSPRHRGLRRRPHGWARGADLPRRLRLRSRRVGRGVAPHPRDRGRRHRAAPARPPGHPGASAAAPAVRRRHSPPPACRSPWSTVPGSATPTSTPGSVPRATS